MHLLSEIIIQFFYRTVKTKSVKLTNSMAVKNSPNYIGNGEWLAAKHLAWNSLCDRAMNYWILTVPL